MLTVSFQEDLNQKSQVMVRQSAGYKQSPTQTVVFVANELAVALCYIWGPASFKTSNISKDVHWLQHVPTSWKQYKRELVCFHRQDSSLHNYLRPQGHAFKSHFLLNGYKKKKKNANVLYIFPINNAMWRTSKQFQQLCPLMRFSFPSCGLAVCMWRCVCACSRRVYIYLCQSPKEALGRPCWADKHYVRSYSRLGIQLTYFHSEHVFFFTP